MKFIEHEKLIVADSNLSIPFRDSLVYVSKDKQTPGKRTLVSGRLYTYPDALEVTNILGYRLPTVEEAVKLAGYYKELVSLIEQVGSTMRIVRKNNLFDKFLAGFADSQKNCFSLKEGGFYWTADENTQLALYPDGTHELLECGWDVYLSIRPVR